MSKKTKTESKNSYEYLPTPVTPQITEAQTVAKDLRGQIDPQIKASYAQQRHDLENSFLNPMGAYTTPAIREATLHAGKQELAQQESQALNQASFLGNQADFDRQMQIAGLTAPRLVQTGGQSTQTESGAGFWLPQVIGGASQIGSAAIM